MNKNLIETTFKTSITFGNYHRIITEKLSANNNANFTEDEKEKLEITKLNLHRMDRILKSYKPGQEISSTIKSIKKSQKWLIITEDWCGDSAQTLPYIYKIVENNNKIEIGILSRDENPEIMDMYLTNGSRSVPKLIAFDENFNELFQWGPRPQEGKELVANWKNEGLGKNEFIEKLHLWYGRNRGKAVEKDFIELLSAK